MKSFQKHILHTAILCIIISVYFVLFLHIWDADIFAPLGGYSGRDDIMYATMAKNAMSGDSFYINENLAAPYTQELYSFPLLMFYFLTWCKFVGVFTDNWVVALNSYYFLSYLLAALAFYALSKQIGIRNHGVSLIGALAFSFTQYHILHRMEHVTATAFFVCALALLLVIYLYQGKFEKKIQKNIILQTVLFCVLIGCADIYYAFFACFMLCYMVILSFLKHQRRTALAAIIMLGLIVGTLLFCLWPDILYAINHGTVISRQLTDPYRLGFLITSFFLPFSYQTSALKALTIQYVNNANLPTVEVLYNYIGLLGCIGLFCMLYWIFFGIERKDYHCFITKLFLALLFLSTVGGFGFILALLGMTQIRCYTRVFPLLFALLLLLLCLMFDSLIARKKVYLLLLVALFLFHSLDLSPWSIINSYQEDAINFSHDKDFVHKMENYLDDGDMILQLPYAPGVENYINGIGNQNRHFIGYLFQTKDLRWSFGALTDSEANQELTARYDTNSVEQILWYAREQGYAGIYVDSDLLDNQKQFLISGLKTVLGDPQVNEGSLYYFNLKDINLDSYFKNILPAYRKGFYYEETNNSNSWRWSGPESSMDIINPLEDCTAVLRIKVNSYTEKANLKITINDNSSSYAINSNISDIWIPCDLHSGSNIVKFSCDATRYERDDMTQRLLSFCVSEAVVIETYEIKYLDGFWQEETNGIEKWHWSGQEGIIEILETEETHCARLNILLSAYPENVTLTVRINGETNTYIVSQERSVISAPCILSPGSNIVDLFCSTVRYENDNPNQRKLGVQVFNVTVE